MDVFDADGGRAGAIGEVRVCCFKGVLADTHASLAGSLS